MRFAVLVHATPESEAGILPSSELLAAMGAFNEQLANDGVLLAGEGLKASSNGARLRFSGGRPAVVDGPFAETKELIAGFWVVQGKSKEEVIERFSRAPFEGGQELEIRPIFEADDFGDALTDDVRRQNHALWSRGE